MTITELIERSGSLTVPEAVAIVLSLISTPAAAADLHEPYGPPTPDNVEVEPDGSVICTGCATTPAVSEAAILLQSLLARTPRIPGGLRYAIGRALLDVEAPPFDSLDEFTQSISRFEDGDRRTVVRGLLDRAGARLVPMPRLVVRTASPPPPAPDAAKPIDRRLHGPRPDQLRRELRAADELLFTRTVADKIDRIDRPSGGAGSGPRSRAGWWVAAAAAVLLVAGGAALPIWHRWIDAQLASTPAAPQIASRTPAAAALAPPADADDLPVPAPARANPAVASASERHDPAPARSDDDWLVPTLDPHQRPVFSPSFASNGSAVFTAGNRDARSAVMSSDPADDQLRVMTILDDGARNYHVQASPDGRQIAFDSDRDGDRGVYVANRDGSNVHRVSGPGYAAVPTWSPDGKQLAFVRAERDNARVWNLWLLTLATGGSERLTSYRYGQPWAASWFPDGHRIAYTHEDRLYVLDVQTRATESFVTPVAGHSLRTPAVSPDGTRIAFQVSRNGVWMLDLPDGSMRCVLQDPTAEDLAWAPDSRRIAFHSRRDGQWGVYVMAKRN